MKTLASILITAVLAAGATYVVVSGGTKPKLQEMKDQHEKALSKLKRDHNKALMAAKRASGGFVDPPLGGTSKASAPIPTLVAINSSPVSVLKALPGLYGSNDRITQRRRIYFTEMLVDIGPEALGAIENVLNDVDVDYEPDIAADRLKRTAESFGVSPEQAQQLAALVKEMQPKLEEERSARREEWGTKFGEFRTSVENLSAEERRTKYREFFEQARQEREEAPEPTEGASVELTQRTKAIVGDVKYDEMEKERPGTVRRLLGELGGRTSGRDRGRWTGGDRGRGTGGDRGRGSGQGGNTGGSRRPGQGTPQKSN